MDVCSRTRPEAPQFPDIFCISIRLDQNPGCWMIRTLPFMYSCMCGTMIRAILVQYLEGLVKGCTAVEWGLSQRVIIDLRCGRLSSVQVALRAKNVPLCSPSQVSGRSVLAANVTPVAILASQPNNEQLWISEETWRCGGRSFVQVKTAGVKVDQVVCNLTSCKAVKEDFITTVMFSIVQLPTQAACRYLCRICVGSIDI